MLENGIKHICILNGGIQSAIIDTPEILKEKGKSTPLNFYKNECKKMNEIFN